MPRPQNGFLRASPVPPPNPGAATTPAPAIPVPPPSTQPGIVNAPNTDNGIPLGDRIFYPSIDPMGPVGADTAYGEIIQASPAIGSDLIRFGVDSRLVDRKLYAFLFVVASSATEYAFESDIVLYRDHTVIGKFPLNDFQSAITTQSRLTLVASNLLATPVENVLQVSVASPATLTGCPTTVNLIPVCFACSCDEVGLNVRRVFNVTGWRAIVAMISGQPY